MKKYINNFETFLEKMNFGKKDVKIDIKNARIPKEYKEIAIEHLKQYSHVKNSKIFGLSLHKDLSKKIKENGLPNGFDMGIDKDGFFIHTHRARSKSYEISDKIPFKDIKFIDSTG